MSGRHDDFQAILSAAHDDPASVDAASLAAARRHAAGCRRCATFVRGLERLDAAAGSERAGDDLV